MPPVRRTGSRLCLTCVTLLLAAQPAPARTIEAGGSALAGTSWRLVRFQGGDGTIVTPPDSDRYTLDFGKEGRLALRIDCNRARGTWRATAAGGLALGPLALTRASCPGDLNDRLARHWTAIRSFVIRDGHLHLALMADGGIYEFEPVARAELHRQP